MLLNTWILLNSKLLVFVALMPRSSGIMDRKPNSILGWMICMQAALLLWSFCCVAHYTVP